MKPSGDILRDPRVAIYVAFVALALIFILTPLPDYLNLNSGLKYGLDLEGGSWLQLQLEGAMVQVDADPEMILKVQFQALSVEKRGDSYIVTVAGKMPEVLPDNLGYPGAKVAERNNTTRITILTYPESIISNFIQKGLETDVKVVGGAPVQYEIRANVTRESLNALLAPVGGSIPSREDAFIEGVRQETVDETKKVLDSKLNRLGLQDIKVKVVENKFILIDLAGIDVDEAQDVVGKPGKFEVRFQTQGNESMHVLYGDAVESVDISRPERGNKWGVPFALSEGGAEILRKIAIDVGATKNPKDHELSMYLDKDVIFSAPLSPELAASLQKVPVRSLVAEVGTGDEGARAAKTLEIHLRAGALPVNVRTVGSGQVAASLGRQFKVQMILAAIFALLAVVLMVYYRYREPRIVLPMITTSFSEVILMLGFWAALGFQIDLASLAGIILVVGTGIDHLVIITDELLRGGGEMASSAGRSIRDRAAAVAEKEAEMAGKTAGVSGKVYLSRLSRAFLIIVGAAFTTIAAMLPLLFMGFGALTGFAFIIIIGVLIGVLIARPAYGRIIGYILAET